MFNKGIIYNQDADSLLYGVGKNGCTLTVEEMENYASQFKGSHMTDIMLCLNNSCSTFPSKTRTSLVDKYHQKIENGIEVDYTGVASVAAAHHIYEVLGIDHIEVEIRTFREIGINPWISFRMNDFHDFHLPASPILPDFFHEHPEVRRVKYHPEFRTNNGDLNMDYTHQLVRDHMLSFIEESLDRYDAYGVELDYTREIEVFANGYEYDGIEIMNQFVRDVYALCGKYGEKYGHKLKLAVRVAPGVEQNMDFGLNVMQWVQEGMIDLVTIAGRFESNDNDMPIKLWKTLLTPYNVELAAGIEMNICPYMAHKPFGPTLDTFAACAANAYSQGADRIYFYNYFHPFQAEHIKADDSVSESTPNFHKGNVYSLLGDFEKTLKLDRRHIWSINDRQPHWKRGRIVGSQLPVTLTRSVAFKITVGDIPEGAKVSVHMGYDDLEKAKANPPRIFVNSQECTYTGTEENHRTTAGTVCCYDVPATAHKSNIFVFIIVNEETTVDYIEAYIKAPTE